MSDRIQLNVEPLTLSNLGDGSLEAQFQRALAEISDVLDDPETLEASSGSLRSEITIKVVVEHNVSNRSTTVEGGLTLKLPQFRRVRRPVLLRGGQWLHEPDTQEPLRFPKPVED